AHLTLQSAMPQLAVDPGDAGDEAVGLDRAKDRSGFGVDLMDPPLPILTDPERSLGPGEARVTSAAWRRNGAEHATGLRFALLDAILGELIEMPAVAGGAGMRGDIDWAQHRAAHRIEGVHPVASSKPDV